MTEATPLACTLRAGELADREAAMTALGRAALRGVERGERDAILRFAPEPGIRARLGLIVEQEAACCAFLDLAVRDEDGEVLLTVAAPRGAEAVVAQLVAAFAAGKGNDR